MTPSQTSQSRGMPPVLIGIYCSPVKVQRGGLWPILWQLSLSDRSFVPLLYIAVQSIAVVYSILGTSLYR